MAARRRKPDARAAGPAGSPGAGRGTAAVPAASGLDAALPVVAVADGVEYTGILRTATHHPFVGFLGVVLGIASFFTFTPLVTQLLVGAFWLATGRQGTFAETYAALLRYEHPFGMIAAQLGIAMLIPISLALLRFVHRVRPGYVFSVTGRLRWGPLGVFLGVALVSLNAVLWLTNALLGRTYTLSPQPGLLAFLVAILLTSPLQVAAEEIFFRGYLLLALGSQVPIKWFGIVASAFVFALFHGTQNPWLFGSRFAFGVLAAVLVVYVGGLEAGIAAHVINNVFAFVYAGLTTGIDELKAIREITPVDAVGEIVMYAVFTVIALLVARRLGLETRTAASGLVRAQGVG
nr:CPBP family intramembrane metalloprotease [Propionibacterium sp.]